MHAVGEREHGCWSSPCRDLPTRSARSPACRGRSSSPRCCCRGGSCAARPRRRTTRRARRGPLNMNGAVEDEVVVVEELHHQRRVRRHRHQRALRSAGVEVPVLGVERDREEAVLPPLEAAFACRRRTRAASSRGRRGRSRSHSKMCCTGSVALPAGISSTNKLVKSPRPGEVARRRLWRRSAASRRSAPRSS